MPDTPASRRQFVASLGATIGAVVVSTSCASTRALAPAAAVTRQAGGPGRWDDSWTTHLGTHRTAFDVAEIEAQPGAGQIAPVMDAWHEVLGTTDRDLGFVLVVRHMAVPMVFGDAVWAKYDVAGAVDMKHREKDGTMFRRNPFASLVTAVQQRGVVVLACHSAAWGLGAILAQRAKVTDAAGIAAVRQEVMAGALPGVIFQPNGLYALTRAHDVGCGIMR